METHAPIEAGGEIRQLQPQLARGAAAGDHQGALAFLFPAIVKIEQGPLPHGIAGNGFETVETDQRQAFKGIEHAGIQLLELIEGEIGGSGVAGIDLGAGSVQQVGASGALGSPEIEERSALTDGRILEGGDQMGVVAGIETDEGFIIR
ncbi:hypothetical protein D3C76_575920 [compost metagenome]